MSAFLERPRTAIFGFSLVSGGISGESESESSDVMYSFFVAVTVTELKK